MSTTYQLEPSKMAEIVINGEAFKQKIKNVQDHLETQLSSMPADSDKGREAKAVLAKEIEDMSSNISKKLETAFQVVDEMKVQLEALENSDEIFAAARASATESSAQGEVSLAQ